MAEAESTYRAALADAETKKVVISDLPVPVPGPKQVLVKVHASAINRADTLQRKGKYPPPAGAPATLGLELAGTVEAVGEGCDADLAAVGKPVMALVAGGGNAEYAVVKQELLMPVPAGHSFMQAAAIPETWLTAYQLLHFVGMMKEGDDVLVHAGGSGVGTAAIQLALAAGARNVYVTAGTDEKIAHAVELGAAAGYNYKTGPWAPPLLEATDSRGVDVILDCVGGSYVEQNTAAIALDGSWVLYGLMGGPTVEGPFLRKLLGKRVKLQGTTLRTRSLDYKSKLVASFTDHAISRFSDGTFKTVIDSSFSLEELQAAHDKMESNTSTGKICIVVDDAAESTP